MVIICCWTEANGAGMTGVEIGGCGAVEEEGAAASGGAKVVGTSDLLPWPSLAL